MSEAGRAADEVLGSWSALYAARNDVRARYRSVWDIPLAPGRDRVLFEELKAGDSVLEIGASDRSLEIPLKRRFSGLGYKSMDVDTRTHHDYNDLDAVGEKFDAVLAFEVIEHMPFDRGVRLLAKVYDLLLPGGKLVMTTPNVAHPTHYFRDPTHVMPYSHEGLGGVLIALSFQVARMHRIYEAPLLPKMLRKYVFSPVHRYLGIDFAHTLLVVAARPPLPR